MGPELLPEQAPPGMPQVPRLALERYHEGSRPGRRDDDRVLAMVVEGGGERGVISAGMGLVWEQLGLTRTVDVMYGVSSGAFTGLYMASGIGALGANNFERTANSDFSSLWRLLRQDEPVAKLDEYLIDGIISHHIPLLEAGLPDGPEFRAVGADVNERSVVVMAGFDTAREALQASRASASNPLLSGEPTVFRGREITDGGLLNSNPYDLALEAGATDVIVLRSRPVEYGKPGLPEPLVKALGPLLPNILALLMERSELYNRQAAKLLELSAEGGPVFQVVPSPDVPRISRTEHSVPKVRAGLKAGAQAMAAVFGIDGVELQQQPTVYAAG